MRYNRRRNSRSRSSLTESQVIRKIARIIRESDEVEICQSGNHFYCDVNGDRADIYFDYGDKIVIHDDDTSFRAETVYASVLKGYEDEPENSIPSEPTMKEIVKRSFELFLDDGEFEAIVIDRDLSKYKSSIKAAVSTSDLYQLSKLDGEDVIIPTGTTASKE